MSETYKRSTADAVRDVANAITPLGVHGKDDENGGFVESLTEAVMGLSTSVNRVADALFDVAAAIRERPS